MCVMGRRGVRHFVQWRDEVGEGWREDVGWGLEGEAREEDSELGGELDVVVVDEDVRRRKGREGRK